MEYCMILTTDNRDPLLGRTPSEAHPQITKITSWDELLGFWLLLIKVTRWRRIFYNTDLLITISISILLVFNFCVLCLPACQYYSTCPKRAKEGRRGGSYPLELELQVFVRITVWY